MKELEIIGRNVAGFNKIRGWKTLNRARKFLAKQKEHWAEEFVDENGNGNDELKNV